MNIGKIEENVQSLIKNLSKEEFVYDLLLAYDLPKASITRLKTGAYNLSKNKGGSLFEGGREILWKKKLLFKEVFDKDLHAFIDNLRRDEDSMKHSPRFMIVTDYKTLLAYDTKIKDTLDVELKDLPKHFDFFLPWAGMEKAQSKLENPADVKAAEKMAKLYDLIRQDNPDDFKDREALHRLNIFLSRLLFCYFAEDTEIFTNGIFTSSIISHTQEDGNDLDEYLDRLFDVLNDDTRKNLPKYLEAFPYVNGGLFGERHKSPKFSPRSRKMLIECGSELNWSEINPDIFGSMIQAVVHPDQRGGMGMHYTSVTNIMKVIEPLFLNDLHKEFEKNKHNPQRLDKLLSRLSTIRVFDPDCGSGNFLIIAYKELRKLEIDILRQIKKISEAASGFDDAQKSLIPKDQLNFASA
ncbi:MAG: type IIL restriction-modification enzyme MmeI [Alphaproteobacteria bacterium]